MALPRRSRAALLVCCGTLFLGVLDGAALNLALPSLQRDLRLATAELQWVAASNALVRASLTLLCGAIADRYGRRRIFRLGLGVFVVGSLACSVAPDAVWLVGSRGLQGAGGALMAPPALALITSLFPDAGQRGRALGTWSATAGVSAACGPLVGGVLVQAAGWRSVFWVGVGGAALLYLGTWLLPEGRVDGPPRRLDAVGNALAALALVGFTFTLIDGPSRGWTSGAVLVAGAVGLAAALGYAPAARRRADPVLDPAHLAVPALRGAVLSAVVAYLALGGFTFVNTFHLQQVLGFSPLATGLLTLPTTVGTLILANVSGRVVGRHGGRLPATVGHLCFVASMTLLALVVATDAWLPLLLVGYLLLGAGMGLVNPPATNAAVTSLPGDRAGVASAITSAARQVGTNLGVAGLGAVLVSVLAASGQPTDDLARVAADSGQEYVTALRVAYGLVAVIAALAAGATWRLFRPPPARTEVVTNARLSATTPVTTPTR
ncbi:MFS transporter [Micromonospora sagamiensis]|uniref:EmrB/QacA subfamily drug resistance transporter n=1 Tax=Micromonospora sagamiensis TaxID=47875 RepID=A0A562WFF2_9ACTN|nr:MFS transporter [Micromonospora sagamiensis]TWJ28993.1 EmrB/QacA subfamily drug resistance transporter [Micromonospora sagamiensis]BCL17983.1 MFS transporter [Micromonospora sagamiensis]